MPEVKQYSIDKFMCSTKISGFSFSHDEQSILFTSDESGVSNAYSVAVTGGPPRQLTHSLSENIQALSYFCHDNRVLFSRDYGNSENAQLLVREVDGTETLLTRKERIQSHVLGWSGNGRSFYCSTNQRDERFFDLLRVDTDTYQWSLLFQNDAGYDFCDVSPDERFALLMLLNSKSDTNLYIYEFATGQMQCITPHTGEVFYGLAFFDRCSSYIYYITNQKSEFRYVERYDRKSGRIEQVAQEDGDICYLRFSRSGKYSVMLIRKEGNRYLKVFEVKTMKPIKLPSFEGSSIVAAGFSNSENLIAFHVEGDCNPKDLYLHDLTSRRTQRLTRSLNPEIDSRDLVDSQIISYKSFDGLEIPGLLWKPHGVTTANKSPALVWIHGGPGGRVAKGYKGRIQYLVNHGYVVLAVNYRGSFGYGKTFYALDVLKHGREPLWDCLFAKRYLSSLGYVDASRIGVIGASFGGYMVLAALTFHPDEFAAGVDICGTSDWTRLFNSLPRYWEPSRELLHRKIGSPYTDKDMLRDISPVFHANRITRPVMILQGAKDPRCPRQQSDEMVEAIRMSGGCVEYMVFEDEAHGFRKRSNAIKAYGSILNFLDRHLKNGTDRHHWRASDRRSRT